MTKKLIIIDDSATQLNFLKTFFANNGWEVCGVQSAKIGYEMIFDYAPDLIITDAVMPLMGGFQLLKLIRENEKISKIPIIVYSILAEANAKFYINEQYSEYFLRKENNHDELLNLANNIVEKYPLDEEYKEEILKIGEQNFKVEQELKKELSEDSEENFEIQDNEEQQINIQKFDFENFCCDMEKNDDFSIADEKLFQEIFNVFHKYFEYDLCVLNVFSYEDENNKVYFDLKDILLSPIFRNMILNKYNTTLSVMYKKYAPNLFSVVQESEFLSKIELEFKYKEQNIADLVFYSRDKLKWENIEDIESVKEKIYKFFKARHIERASKVSKKDDLLSKYFSFNKFKEIKHENNVYFVIAQIVNFSELSSELSFQEIDIVNSKISEKIISHLERDEQVYKNDEDEYNIVLFAKDEKQLHHRLEYILKDIDSIEYNSYKVDSLCAAISCNVDGVFNIVEAQKKLREFMDDANELEKVVIFDAKE